MQARRRRLVSRPAVRAVIVFALTVCAACDKDSGNDGGPVPNGARLGWTQVASSLQVLQSLTYRLYVDGARMTVSSVSCSQTAVSGGYECSGRLPNLSLGRHVLELTSILNNVESDRSRPLTITITASTSLSSSSDDTEDKEDASAQSSSVCITEPRQCYDARDVGSGFESVTALSALPDGRILFIENRARVRVITGDSLLSEPALTAPPDGSELVGLASDTGFNRTRSVFVSWSQPTVDGRSTLNITRYRELAGTLGEGAAIVTALPFHDGTLAPLSVDSEGLLYVALPGAILRFSRDGFVPSSNAGGLPAIAQGYAQPTSLTIDTIRGRVWLAGHDSQWSSAVSRLSIARLASRPEPIAGPLPESGPFEPSLTLMPAARGQQPWLLVSAGGRFFRGIPNSDGRIADVSPLILDRPMRLRSAANGLNGSWYVVTGIEPSLSVVHLVSR